MLIRPTMLLRPKGTFKPSDLVAVKAWFDPNTGVTKDGSNNVSDWTDRVGGLTVSYPAEGTKSVWSATSFNSTPGITFNGTTRLVSVGGSGAFAATDGWMFMAARLLTNNASFFNYGVEFGTAGGAWALGWKNSGTQRLASVDEAGTNADGTTDALGADVVASGRHMSAGVPELFRNGTQEAVGVSPSQTLVSGNVAIGGPSFAATGYCNFRVGHVVIATALTAIERQQIEGYCAWASGLQANLPGGHLFRNSPP